MEPQSALPYPQSQKISGVAIASLVASLCGIGLAGVICGHIALSNIKKATGALGGKGLAIAGLVIGYLQIAALMLFGAFLLLFAGQLRKEAEWRAKYQQTISSERSSEVEVLEQSMRQEPERVPTIPDQQ